MTGSASLNSPCPRIKYGASSELDSGMGVIHPLRETPSHLNPPPQWGEEVDFHGNCPWPLRATYEDENDMASSPSLPLSRESTPRPWIPACAEMTVVGDAAPFRVWWGNLALAIFIIMTE